MTKDQILARISQIVVSCEKWADPERLVNGALTVMSAVYGPRSHQVQSLLARRAELSKLAAGASLRNSLLTEAVKGTMENLREEIEAGLLSSLERRITSDILSDLIQLARAALSESGDGPKNVAAVLAAAAYEDALRRIAKEHAGVIGQDKLDKVIDQLKDAELLVAPQLGIALSYLNFRNRALHAQWDTIDRAGVERILSFVEQLLLKHFD